MKPCSHGSIQSMILIPICMALVLLAACNGTEVGNPEKIKLSVSGDMTGFSDNAELETYLKDQYTKSVFSDYPYDLEGGSIRNDDVIGGEFDGGGDALGPEIPVSDDSNDYTGTNLQESGVDEADVVKTDGEFMYVAGSYGANTSDRISVVRTVSPMTTVSTIHVKGSVSDLFLYEDSQDQKLLVVLYRPNNFHGEYWVETGIVDAVFIGIPYWIPIRAKAGVAVFDISDPAAPTELKALEFDGYLVTSRRIENRLHLVLQFLPRLPPPYLLENEIADMTIQDLVPYYADVTGTDQETERHQLVAPEDFYHPEIDGGGSIVSMVTLDLDNLDLPLSSTGVVADASIVYASTQALYITSTFWNTQLTTAEEPAQQTIIYKFDLNSDPLRGRGFITVPGRAINQFSLGEYDNVLRIATTTGWSRRSQPTSKNHVYCIGMQDDKLEVIGSLEDLAPGEEIYAARFIGPRGYLVTFVTIDPLFTLDLSDPTDPKVAGELKVPGYSEYIHPWGDNHLLTIGKDALEVDGNAWYQGLQLTIFDISDFSDPRLLHRTESETKIGDRGTSSDALYNHKAFTFWAEQGLLAIPVDLYEHESPPTNPWEWGTLTFKGLYVFRVDLTNGFELLGRINTLAELDQYWLSYFDYTRGIFIDDQVYAVTPAAVRSAEVDDIANSIETLLLD